MTFTQPVVPITNPARTCGTCAVRKHCLARELEGDSLARFEACRGQVRILRRDRELFRAGEKFETLLLVRSGAIKVFRNSEDGEEQIVGFHFAGELLGCDGIENGVHASTAVALETSSVCAFPYQRLFALAMETKELQSQLLRLLSADIGARQAQMLTLARKDAEGRVAAFLLSLAARLKRVGFSATEFRLAMGRHEIGNYLGMNLETVSRVFTRLHASGLISRDRRFIRLLDMARLEARASGSAAANAAVATPIAC